MYRPPKNRAVCLVSVSLLQGWGLSLVIVIEVEVGTGKKIMMVIVKKFIVGIRALELNLFRLITCVSYYRVYRRELKLIAACLTTLLFCRSSSQLINCYLMLSLRPE